MRAACIAGVLFVAASLPALAATTTVYKVAVVDNVNEADTVGALLVYALREAIRQSAGFVLQATDASAPHLTIVISTVDPDMGTPSARIRTCYCVVFTDPHRVYVASFVSFAGAARVNDAAKGILAELDKELQAAH
jgi:hypothetical protein